MTRRMNQREIDALYERACHAAEHYFRNSDNPDARLAPFERCILGQQALTCQLLGINTLRLRDCNRQLERSFPGCEVYVEELPDGKAIYKWDLYILVDDDDAKHHQPRTYSAAQPPSKPSTEWLAFLVCAECVLITAVYVRFATGAAF